MADMPLNVNWPASVRLNKDLRRRFVKTVMEDVIPDESRPRTEDFISEWNSQMYDIVFKPYLEHLNALPEWAVRQSDSFYLNMLAHEPKDSPWRHSTGRLRFQTPDGKPKVMSIEDTGYYSSRENKVPQPPAGHDCIDAYKKLLQQQKDWDVKKQQLERQLETAVEGCNTSHQLFRVWPKAVQYSHVFPEPEKKEIQRGGNPDVSGAELDIGVSLTKATVSQY